MHSKNVHTSGPGNPGGPGKPLGNKRNVIIYMFLFVSDDHIIVFFVNDIGNFYHTNVTSFALTRILKHYGGWD